MNLLVKSYFLAKKFFDYLDYAFSKPSSRKIIVLTFDDHVDKKNIAVAEYLKSKKISATFFITLAHTKPAIIKNLVVMGHEIGGHSLTHTRKEREEKYRTAEKCFSELKKYYSVVSWRFPWTSRDNESLRNVKNAGFVIDSSIGTFYPVKKIKKINGLYEIPWLRLPKTWQMDVNEKDYSVIKNHIIDIVSSKSGVFVFGFHTYYQHKNFEEFKELIESLLKINVEFMTLRKAVEVLKNEKI